MKYNLTELIDINKSQRLLESFCDAAGIGAAIIDLEGNIIIESRWQKICSKFHRNNKDTAKNCLNSDTQLANEVPQGNKFSICRCRNGLTDAVSPIIIKNTHVANVFAGQFLLEPPDIEFFRNQAAEYGFEEKSYLNALSEISVISEKKLTSILNFLTTFTEIITTIGLERLKHLEARQELKEVYDIVSKSPAVILLWKNNAGWPVEFVSENANKLFGYTAEEFISGKVLYDMVIHPDDLERVAREIETFSNETERESFAHKSYRIITKTGDVKWVDDKTFIRRDRKGKITHYQGIVEDITNRKLAEKEQGKLRTQLSTALEIANLAPWEYDVETAQFTFNDYFYSIYHTTVRQMGGYKKTIEEYISHFVHQEDIHIVKEVHDRLLEVSDSNTAEQTEYRIMYADGGTGHVNARIYIVRDSEGRPTRAYGVIQDITGRKRAQEELLEAKDKYTELFNQSAEGIYLFDSDGYIIDVNHMACRQSGYSREELLNLNITDLNSMREDYSNFSKKELLKRLSQWQPGQRYILEAEYRKKDGTIIPIQTTTGTVHFGNRDLFLTIAQDISDRKRAEKELQRSKNRLESLWSIAQIADSDLKTIYDHILAEVLKITESEYAFYGFLAENNKSMLLHAYSQKTMADCQIRNNPLHFPIDEASIWTKAIREKRIITLNDFLSEQPEKKGVPKGHVPVTRLMTVPLVINDRVVSIAAVANKKEEYTEEDEMQIESFLRNVQILIERKRSEEEKLELTGRLQQAQKMESIGTLAGGIAHDFNNILSPIMGYSEMAMMELPPDSPIQNSIKQIHMAGDRAKELVKQILTFARKRDEERLQLKASTIVKEVIKFLRSTIPTTVDIQYHLRAKNDLILADPTQMNQIMINLCTNAAHAMEEKGGTIDIVLENEYLEPHLSVQWPDNKHSHYLKITVRDTGYGIESKILDRIFDPYFTTKEIGKGTGMGLALVHSIVKNHGGKITVQSEKGKGAAFLVWLPLIQEEVDENETLPEKVQYPLGKKEKILFVDDEMLNVDLFQAMFEKLGYTITSSTGSVEALETFRKSPHSFDLVVTDMTMPNMTGKDLAKKILSIRPDIPIILCTGFSERINEYSARAMGFKAFVMKPMALHDIARTIRNVLDQNQPV